MAAEKKEEVKVEITTPQLEEHKLNIKYAALKTALDLKTNHPRTTDQFLDDARKIEEFINS